MTIEEAAQSNGSQGNDETDDRKKLCSPGKLIGRMALAWKGNAREKPECR